MTGRRPLYIVAATGNITVNANIDLSGKYMLSTDQDAGGLGGAAGGYQAMRKRNYTPGVDSGPGAGGFGSDIGDPTNTALMRAAGGAGYGGAGGMNSANSYAISQSLPVPTNGVGGGTYGDQHLYILYGGSGAGAGKDFSGDGGGGGAIGLKAQTGDITIGGVINCDGGPGMVLATDVYVGKQARYAGGGGAGGSIRIDAGNGTVTINGSLSAKGGHGSNAFFEPKPWTRELDNTGHCAGGGGGGRIAIYTKTGSYSGNEPNVSGGAGGQFLSDLLEGEYTWDGDAGGNGTFQVYAGPMAVLAYDPAPADEATDVSIFTDLQWTHAEGASSQDVYFETSTGSFGLVKHDATGTLEQVTAAELQAKMGGALADLTTYHWKVASNDDLEAAAVWSFTTGDAKPHDPVPADDAYEAPYGASVTVSWTSDISLSASGADVYIGTDAAAVAAKSPALKYTAASTPYTSVAVNAPDKGVRYYWMVEQQYGATTRTSDVWTFRTVSKKINLKTGTGTPLGSAWYLREGTDGDWQPAVVDDANVANYQFTTFDYDSTWDVNVTGRRAFAIWADSGDLNFDGRLNVTGGTALNTSHKGGAGIAGGWDGGGDQQGDAESPPWPLVTTDQKNGPGHGNPSNISVQNPGMTAAQTSIGGSGAGYGGEGGWYSRYLPGFGGAGGISYGQPEVYALLGGSGGAGGGTGSSSGGGGGGGAVEFYAKACNITLGANTQIRANGGTIDERDPANNDLLEYPGGGGSGGAVRLVASGNVSVAGLITANGGVGGDRSSGDPCDCGGGGGGGRIAIYAGGAYTNTGTIAVTGGARGIDTNGSSWAKSGADGSIYTTGKASELLKPHGIAPANGYMGWDAASDPNLQKVSWYPALGSTQNELYFGTSQASLALVATYTEPNGLRQQKVYNTGPLTANAKYYWRVDYKYGANPTVTGPVWVFGTGICTALDGDLDGDCKVTFVDFALMASKWRVCNLALLSNCNL